MSITVYSNPSCVQCEMTKKQFDKAGVAYESKMIQDSPEVLSLIEEKGYKAAPVVVTESTSWSGFQPTHIFDAIQSYKAETR